jgi:hypothetical protein
MSDALNTFAKRFLTGRLSWNSVPRVSAIYNYGDIISLVLYRQGQFQVELFIAPCAKTHFPPHKHPDVDVIEFALAGSVDLYISEKKVCTSDQVVSWLAHEVKTVPVVINATDLHYGYGHTPYAFLSMQEWLHDTVPTSVGLNWEGEPSSVVHRLWLDRADALYSKIGV